MLFAVDIGNTNVVIAVFDGNKIIQQWRISSDTKRTGDEYTSIILTLCRDAGIDTTLFSKGIISSVVPALIGPFVIVCQRVVKKHPYVINTNLAQEGTILPVHLSGHSSRELGTDLLCNAVSAWNLFHGANIVVDFGTAVKALAMNTAQLPFVPLEAPRKVIGATTKEAIQSGIVLGYKGLVESLVSQVKNNMHEISGDKPEDIKVVATGGLNSVLKPITDCFTIVDKELTLKGLKLISELI